jgi:hypothetical protein
MFSKNYIHNTDSKHIVSAGSNNFNGKSFNEVRAAIKGFGLKAKTDGQNAQLNKQAEELANYLLSRIQENKVNKVSQFFLHSDDVTSIFCGEQKDRDAIMRYWLQSNSPLIFKLLYMYYAPLDWWKDGDRQLGKYVDLVFQEIHNPSADISKNLLAALEIKYLLHNNQVREAAQKMRQVQIHHLNLEGFQYSDNDSETAYYNHTFDGIKINGANCSNIHFSMVHIKNAEIDDVAFDSANFLHVNFSGSKMRRNSARDTLFNRVRLNDVDLADTNFGFNVSNFNYFCEAHALQYHLGLIASTILYESGTMKKNVASDHDIGCFFPSSDVPTLRDGLYRQYFCNQKVPAALQPLQDYVKAYQQSYAISRKIYKPEAMQITFVGLLILANFNKFIRQLNNTDTDSQAYVGYPGDKAMIAATAAYPEIQKLVINSLNDLKKENEQVKELKKTAAP